MDYSIFPNELEDLLIAMDKAIIDEDYLKVKAFLIEYRKTILRLNLGNYYHIFISWISKLFNNDDVCVKLADSSIRISKCLLELNRFLLNSIKKDVNQYNDVVLLNLVQNYFMIDYLEGDLIMSNVDKDRTYYYDKNRREIDSLFLKNEELKLSIK